LNNLITYIHHLDPGFPALHRSLKTFAAIAVSLLIFYHDIRMAMFASIAALLISRAQTGIALCERRFTLLLTGILLALLSVPVSLISANSLLSVVFITTFAFFTFFLMGLKVVPDFSAIVVLSVCVVEMAFSHTLKSGLQFSGLYLLVTSLVYIMHFVVFPVKPLTRLRTQSNLVSRKLQEHVVLIFSNFSDLQQAIPIVHKSSDAIKNAISDFRRLWQLFSLQVSDDKTEGASLMHQMAAFEKMHSYLILIWQYRAGSFASPVFRRFVLEEPVFAGLLARISSPLLLNKTFENNPEIEKLKQELSAFEQQCVAHVENNHAGETREEWLAVFSVIRALQAMMEAVLNIAPEIPGHEIRFSAKQKTKNFFRMLSEAPDKVNFQNAAFRFGLRSTLIVGATMFFYQFLHIEFGYWLVLFAVLLIRPNLGISIKTGRERLAGTILGSLLAFVFLMVVPPGSVLFYAVILVNLFLMIWFTNLDKMVPMVITLTFIIISLFALIYPGESNLAFLRIVYTAGIVVLVIFLTFFLWPDRARIRLGDALATAIEMEKNYFALIFKHFIQSKEKLNDSYDLKKQIDVRIIATKNLFEAAGNEMLQPGMLRHGRQILVYIQRIYNTLHTLEQSGLLCSSPVGFQKMTVELSRFTSQTEKAFTELANAIRTLGLPAGYPDLAEELRLLELAFNRWIVQESETRKDVKPIVQNSLFIWNLKPLILELEGIKQEILLKMGAV